MDLTFEDLLSTGAHFGHLKRKWNPKYKPYILMTKNGIHIINLDETIRQLEKAINYVKDIVKDGGEILFVGTKKNAKNIVQQEADKCGMFYVVERWLGGTLTNFSTIRRSIKRLQSLEKESSPLYENVTKKELLSLEREMIRLQDQHRGIKDMRRLPDAIVIVDARCEYIAVREAHRLNIPIIAIVDTNTNPMVVEYPIPANDDSIRAVKLIISEIAKAICDVKNIPYPGDEELLADEIEEETESEDAKVESSELSSEKVEAAIEEEKKDETVVTAETESDQATKENILASEEAGD